MLKNRLINTANELIFVQTSGEVLALPKKQFTIRDNSQFDLVAVLSGKIVANIDYRTTVGILNPLIPVEDEFNSLQELRDWLLPIINEVVLNLTIGEVIVDGVEITNFPASQDVEVTNEVNTRPLSSVTDSIEARQSIHDNFNSNSNIQVGNADVSELNPVPVSDGGGSITVDGTIDVGNFPSEFGLPDAQVDALKDVSVISTVGLTDDELRATPVPVEISNFPVVQDINVTASALPTGASTEATLASVLTSLNQLRDKLKLQIGATPATTNVAASITSVTISASDTNLISRVVVNDSSSILYLKYGTGASSTSYTFRLEPNDTAIIQDYNGILTGAWVLAIGNARVTTVKI